MRKSKALIVSCFNWYKARLWPARDCLIKQGYDVTVLIAEYDHIKLAPVQERFPECTYVKVPQYKKNISFARIKSHLSFCSSVNEWIKQNNPEIIYCQVPPNKAAHYCAEYRKSHPNTKLILDIIDLWPESMPLGGLKNTPPANTWRRWRNDAIKIADHVFTECELYQEKLSNIIDPSKTSTLHLFKDQTEEDKQLVQSIINKEKIDNVVRFAYLGSMNNIIDIEGICGVIKQFIDLGKKCELHAIGGGESKDRFETAVQDAGCKTHFYGTVFDEEQKIRILAPCDYAFNMMKGDITVGLTIKSIDYLSYGLPLINSIKGDTWKLVEKNGIGFNVSEGKSLNIYEQYDHKKVLDVFTTSFAVEHFKNSVREVLG